MYLDAEGEGDNLALSTFLLYQLKLNVAPVRYSPLLQQLLTDGYILLPTT